MASPTRRVNRGGGHSYFLDGEPADGVTRILDAGIAKPGLIKWAAETTAAHAVDNWADLAELTPSKRLHELERARFSVKKAAAARGTTVHDYAARLARGEDVEIPESLEGLVDSYLAFAEAYDLSELAVEATVINRQWRYMGTLDLLATFDGRDDLWLLDYKTSQGGIFPEVALQLAAYAHADAYIDGDGLERPMPPIAHGAAVWLRSDGYDVVPVDISAETFRIFLYAQQLARFANADRSAYVLDALPARTLEAAS